MMSKRATLHNSLGTPTQGAGLEGTGSGPASGLSPRSTAASPPHDMTSLLATPPAHARVSTQR